MAKKLAKISLRLALFGILVGEGNGAGGGSAGLHDSTCPADGDVGAKGGGWELGYGVVGGPFGGRRQRRLAPPLPPCGPRSSAV